MKRAMTANVFAILRCRRSAFSIRVPGVGGRGIIAEFGLLATAFAVLGALSLTAAAASAQQPAAPSGKGPIWSDEFTGPAGSLPDPTKWTFDTGGHGWGNRELQYYTPPEAGNAVI